MTGFRRVEKSHTNILTDLALRITTDVNEIGYYISNFKKSISVISFISCR